jgi:ubiquinone/menaquinone biosynthesis C-methylase UbiE
MAQEKDYVLGTHDAEIARLGLQHRVWRQRAMEAWRRAGFAPGQTILDIGCGPGFATVDLAEVVGPAGRVIAADRSARFLDALSAACTERGLTHVETREMDLDEAAFPEAGAEGAWSRWVFSFVRRPRRLLECVAGALKVGGALVLHEFFDYGTWRAAPRSLEIEAFVREVMESLRSAGGEPDIALDLAGWLDELGFEIRVLRPFVDVVGPSSPAWEWLATFFHAGVPRLVELGRLSSERAVEIARSWPARGSSPLPWMVTPGVLEIVAVRR